MEGAMNKQRKHTVLPFLLILFAQALALSPSLVSDAPEVRYYAIEMNGQVCGYNEVKISRVEEGGRTFLVIEEASRTMISALGAKVDAQARTKQCFDEQTFREISSELEIDQGSFKMRIVAAIEGRTARISLYPGGGEKSVSLPEDIVFENNILFPHLKRDFVDKGLMSKRYRVLDLLDRNIQDVTYTRARREILKLAGQTWPAIVLDSHNHTTGLNIRLWIGEKNGLAIKAEGPRTVSSLADKSVLGELRRANMDNHIFAKAGVSIADISNLTFLKVRASLAPVGNVLTPESLNVPGQTFKGTVTDNRVEGIFEVRHEKYDGRDAPPFPPDFGRQPELRPFLEPEDFIESDDPVLVKKARALTAGAKDSWEAAKRLSRWVAEEIAYGIPGGASARNTYDISEGECGAHSRLFAAFSRAVGIPARVVWGFMFVPSLGGGFGQHGWSEVYMGKPGWIPIDTTAREVDYADSGHVRLGVVSSASIAWNPKKLEILDFRAGAQKFGQVVEKEDMEKYRPYLGKYRGSRGVITVHVQNGSLALTLQDGRKFELRDPDEKGYWFFKLTNDVNVVFDAGGPGRIPAFMMMNRVRIPKRADPKEIPSDVPQNLRRYLGVYPVPMENREITVSVRGGQLVASLPGEAVWELEGPNAEGLWIAKSGQRRFSFILDDAGNVRTMVMIEMIHFLRIE
jgi:transglutaminase-like putative cysteine protease